MPTFYSKKDPNHIDPILSNSDKETLLSDLRSMYDHELSRTETEPDDFSLFSWSSSHIVINICIVSTMAERQASIIFCTRSADNHDYISIKNLFNETNKYSFTQLSSHDEMLDYLIKNNLIQISSKKIIASSIDWHPFSWPDYIQEWVQNEYRNNSKKLEDVAQEIAQFDETPLHLEKYHFSDLLRDVDDPQFKAEFSEMLFAYNNERFFLAATSLGSVLENLMYLTLKNYNELHLLKSRQPTAKNYIGAFEKSKQINLNLRDSSYLDNIFHIRNSMSHYNTGFALKGECDMMLHGLSLIYTRFYKPSKAYHKSH